MEQQLTLELRSLVCEHLSNRDSHGLARWQEGILMDGSTPQAAVQPNYGGPPGHKTSDIIVANDFHPWIITGDPVKSIGRKACKCLLHLLTFLPFQTPTDMVSQIRVEYEIVSLVL